MKNLIFLLVSIICLNILSLSGNAQTYTLESTSDSSVYSNSASDYPTPYGNWYWGNKEQYLILASELQNLGFFNGIISSLEFNVLNLNNCASLNNYYISIGQTTSNSLSNWDSVSMTEVFTSQSYQPILGWNQHNFSIPFVWDGISNILIETCFNNDNYIGDGNASVQYINTPFNATVQYNGDNATVCTGQNFPSAHYKRPVIKLNTQTANVDDMATAYFISPQNGSVGSANMPITVRYFNIGSATQIGFDAAYSIDGGNNFVVESTTDTVAPYSFIDYSFNTTADMSVEGTYNMVAYASIYNDNDTSNDTLYSDIQIFNPLSGTYTIGNDPGKDFNSFNEAVNILHSIGVAGPVTFLIDSGEYNEQITINNIPGISNNNNVTFKSASGMHDVVLTNYLTNNNNYLIALNGAKYITFETINFKPSGYDYGNVITMLNFTSNITVRFCIFDGLKVYGDYSAADLISSHDLVKTDSITITNNVFNQGRYGVSFHSQDSSRSDQLIIKDNIFNDQYALGIDLSYIGAAEINNNVISSSGGSFSAYKGIFISHINKLSSISKNIINIESQNFDAGIYIDDFQPYSYGYDSLIVANNMVSVNFSNTANNYAVRFHNSANFGFYYNSLLVESNMIDTTNIALNITGFGGDITIFNNSIVNLAGGAAYKIDIQSYFSNYNNLFTNGNTLARNVQMNFITLGQIQTLGVGEFNSISVNPNYFSNQDLRTHSVDLNNAATPINGITEDKFGITRNSTTPDIGAFEFTPPANDIQIIDAHGDYSPCSLSANHQIGIILVNKGSASQSNFNVRYQIDQNPVVTETVSSTMAYNDTLIFTFATTADLSSPGPHKIIIYSDLTNDEFRENDSIGGTVISLDSKNLPIYVDFNDNKNYSFVENTNNESSIFIHNDEGVMGSSAIALTGKSNNNWNYYGNFQGDIQAFINANQEHKAILETCPIPTNSLSGLRMSFNMHQDWTDYYSSVFYVKLNDSIYLKDINGDSIWVENGDYMEAYEFDLSSYIGNDIKISFEAVNKYDDIYSYYGNPDVVYLDNIHIYEPFPNDVGIVNAGPNHDDNCWTVGGDSLFVAIKNFGSQPQTNIPVHVEITDADGQSTYNDTFTDTLAPFATSWMHIGSINLLKNGNISAFIYTQLTNDQNNSNDTLNNSDMYHFGVYETDFLHTFEVDSNNWNWYFDGFKIIEGDYFNNYSNILISENYAPYFDDDTLQQSFTESSTAMLNYQYYPISSNTAFYFEYVLSNQNTSFGDKVYFSVSEDCGNTWDSVFVLDNNNAVNIYSSNPSNINLTPVLIPISQYAGKAVHIRVDHLYNYNSDLEFGIDKIGLMETISYSLGNDTNICQGDSIMLSTGLNPSEYSSIKWFKLNQAGNDILLSTNSSYTAVQEGVFYSEVISNIGLPIYDSISINHYDLAQASFLNPDMDLCDGESFNLQIQLQNNGPWTFDINENGQINNYSSSSSYIDTILYPDTNTLYIINNITNAYGCVSPYSDSLMVNINPLPLISVSGLGSDYCENDTIQALTLSPIGGTLSGDGITQSNFDPSIASIGNNQITYSFTDNKGCSSTMNYTTTVHALPQVGIVTQFDSSYCENDSPINVLSFPSGGILSGDGISGNSFDPSIANISSNQIVYEYTDAFNCSNSDTVNIIVNSITPVAITTSFNTSYCADDGPVSLTASPSGGVFFGNGVVGNSFDPALAMSGANLIVYEYTNASGCVSFDSVYVNVNPQPIVSITSQISDLCENSSPVNLNAVPSGGVFSGLGVNGNSFEPSNASLGSNDIVYTYTDINGCSNSDSISVNINSLPTVNIGSLSDICQNSSAITLSGAIPNGGTYSGDAVNSNQSKFHPSIANIGLNEVVYTYSDVNGCINSDTGFLRVIQTPDASFTLDATSCINDSVNITYTGGASSTANFSWDFDGGTIINGANSGPYTISWDTAGIKLVELQVSDSSCSSFNQVNYINVIKTFAQITAVGGTSLCYGDTTFLFANSGANYSYQWFKDGNPLANDTLSFISVAQTGDYSCEITPPNSCSELSNEITVNVNPEIIASFNLQSDACADDMVTINYTGNTGQSATYNWDFDGGIIASGSGSGPYNIVWNNIGLKTVSLTVTDNGCSSTLVDELIQIQSTDALITVVGDTVFCDGESVSLYANAGNYTYEWFKNGQSLNHTQAFYIADQTGNYSVKVINQSNNCMAESNPVGVTVNTTDFNISFTANPTNFTIPPFTTNFINQTPNANSYYWNWSFGDGNTSSLKDPSHTYSYDGVYTVGVIAQNINTGCYDTLSKTDYISCTGGSPNPCDLVAEITAVGNSPICPDDSLLLQAAANPGANYQWLKDGVILTGETNQTYYAKQIGSYQIMVSDTACTQFSSPFVLNHYSTVKPVIASNGTIMPCTNDSMELYVTSFFNSYHWSTGETTQSIYVKNSGDYSVSITDANSCKSTSNDFVVNASLLSTPEICIVSVDSLNHNLIVYERQNNPLIDSFRIYKEGSIANVYNLVHSAHFNEIGLFVDSLSNPIQQSYRYKISAVDTCGVESPRSDYHKTIHLNINAGLNDTWNLIWEGYEGFNFGSYRIYRGTDSTQMTLLTTIPSNLSSYTDVSPPAGKVYYQIEIEAPHACYPDTIYSKANTNYNSSRSNTVNNMMAPNIGISEISNKNINLIVYPNPNDGKFMIDLSSKIPIDGQLQIHNNIGQLLMTKSIKFNSSYNESFDMNNLSKGVYYIRLLTDNEVLTGKIIIQ